MGRHLEDLLSSLEVTSSILTKVLDNRLSPLKNGPIACDIVFNAILALACLNFKPECKPTMKQISQKILAHKWLFAKLFSDITLRQLMIPEFYLDVESEIGITETEWCLPSCANLYVPCPRAESLCANDFVYMTMLKLLFFFLNIVEVPLHLTLCKNFLRFHLPKTLLFLWRKYL